MKQRIITAVIAAAVFLPIVLYGGAPFLLMVYLLATISLYELLKMRHLKLLSVPGIISLILLWIFLLPSDYQNLIEDLDYTKVELALIAVLLFLTYTVATKNRFTFDDVAFSTMAILYIGIGFYYFLETRDAGIEFVFYSLLIVWATDSGAYFIGRAMGKNKLWPEISPNKTVEGFVGGIICALVVAIVFSIFAEKIDAPLLELIIITVLLSIFGQIGDLVESALKRHYNVKDSGSLLPGHGGILDRFDSLLFVWPLIHFFQLI
ncbi:phosphatidate cytidylyltransferase [Bacillus canaveralius]|uniref:Phosphatidate cytidylyltransferase n=1 Tax=Bacillus canaveralius TaxID=1403243 RepID=A0A2N5GP17_9BACI|nr:MULTISPECIES: phosphatidate cytidylyltransferase [Bacillus]PLR84244.1 phosphatidate cytidylyltransferase [Bacillus canaveralius]PLR87437.1 phosphatidate cytidylyltransferase [Bacillus sp. V33-4]PLR89422.1 phosphatidate cytidylyltransferase [Bacillus canaveralius]RSK45101.1 phosphatidate cytidylyltransferase [Bacillus canaveralius]